jgi:hypothetical protein
MELILHHQLSTVIPRKSGGAIRRESIRTIQYDRQWLTRADSVHMETFRSQNAGASVFGINICVFLPLQSGQRRDL